MTKFSANNLRHAKLSNEQVFEMRKLYAEGWTQRALADYFDMSVNHVGRIVRGEARRSVPTLLPDEDHVAAQQRLLALQEQHKQGLVDGLMKDVREEISKQDSIDKTLNKLKGNQA